MSRFAEDIDYFKSQKDFDDIEPYLDMSPVEIDEQSLPVFKPDFSTAVIIDNVPVIGQDKVAKLSGVIMKYIKQFVAEDEADLHLPTDPSTGSTLGFCFVKCPTKEIANTIIKSLNGFAFDKKHTFKVSSYNSLDLFGKMSSELQPPVVDYFPTPNDSEHLTDAACRDQFVIRQADETEIYFADPATEDTEMVYAGERETGKKWCEMLVDWSPKGTYFVTFHKPGVKLWGGAQFAALAKFMHPAVDEVSFSPCENYLITYRNADVVAHDANDAMCVWDVHTGTKLKSFNHRNPLDVKFQVRCTVTETKGEKKIERETRGRIMEITEAKDDVYYTIDEGGVTHTGVSSKGLVALQDPNKLKWSADGKYIARLGPDAISVYELPSMNLLEKKSIAAKEVSEFAWSPKSNILAYFSPCVGNLPAIINIMTLPNRESISSRKLFDVSDGKMVWHEKGDYLAVYASKTLNKKRSYVLLIFRMKDAGIPVEQIEYPQPIHNVSWEPNGSRLAVVVGEERNPSIDFYSMVVQTPAKKSASATASKNGMVPFYQKPNSPCSELHWCPEFGGVLAVVQFSSDSLSFDMVDVDRQMVTATRRHDRGNKACWDPSGRYFSTATITELRNAHAKGRVEDGINFYNFQGTVLLQLKKEKLHHFAWRPRPKDLLSEEEKKAVFRDFKKYEREFLLQDKARKEEQKKERQAARFKVAKEFLDLKNKNRALCAQLKNLRVALRNGYDSDNEDNYTIETVVEEDVIKRTEQVVNK